MSWGYTTLIGLTGLGVGAYVSETAKRAAGSVYDRVGGRGRAARAMNEVVMDVPAMWEGYSYDFEELEVVGMRLALIVTNHSDQLIKNVHVRMRRPSMTSTLRAWFRRSRHEQAPVSPSLVILA